MFASMLFGILGSFEWRGCGSKYSKGIFGTSDLEVVQIGNNRVT